MCSDYHGGVSVDFVVFGVHMLGLSSVLNSLNVVVTVVCVVLRCSLVSVSLLVVVVYLTSGLIVVVMPVLSGCVTLVLLDRVWSCGFYDVVGGGDLVVYQHLFWFFGHPEVYVIVLPVFGIICVSCGLCCGLLFGCCAIMYSSFVIVGLGFYV